MLVHFSERVFLKHLNCYHPETKCEGTAMIQIQATTPTSKIKTLSITWKSDTWAGIENKPVKEPCVQPSLRPSNFKVNFNQLIEINLLFFKLDFIKYLIIYNTFLFQV